MIQKKEGEKKKKKTCDPVENRTVGHRHLLPDLDNQSVL